MHIGLLIERSRAYGRRLCEGIASFASECSDMELDMLNWEDLPKLRKDSGFDAFIVRLFDDEMAKKLKALGKPVVDVFFGKVRNDVAIVDLDNEAISRMVADHFKDRGFKDFAYCGYDGVKFSDDRRESFRNALADVGETFFYRNPLGVTRNFVDVVVKNERYSLGVRENRALLKWIRSLPRPIAVFCSHDLRAHQLLGVCRTNGFKVPDEVAIVGCDNDPILCDLISPALTSVDPNGFEVGRTAASFARRMVLEPELRKCPPRRLVPPKKLVVRASSEIYPITPAFLSEALVFINRHCREGIGASDVFAHLHRAHTHVEAAFRNVLGETVQRAIVRARIASASAMLRESDLSVAEVAKANGFASSQYFCCLFKKETGLTPQALRSLR